MPDSPEEIARRAAEAGVVVYEALDCWNVAVAGKMLPQYHGTQLVAEAHAGEMRDKLAALVLAALREMLAPPAPGGIDAARLAEIRDSIRGGLQPDDDNRFCDEQAIMEDLLADRDYLASVLRACGDGDLASYAAGFDEGKRAGAREGFAKGALAQHEADKRAAQSASNRVTSATNPHEAGFAVLIAVADAPLADPEAPAG